MLRLYIKTICILLLLYFRLEGQEKKCGNGIFFSDSLSLVNKMKTDSLLYQYLSEPKPTLRSEIIIPTVVHIVWENSLENISEELIFNQIEILNKAFNKANEDTSDIPLEFKSVIGNLKVKFCLANKTPDGITSNSIIKINTTQKEIGLSENLYASDKGGSDAWDTDKYLNIWVANTGIIIAGFGTYPNQTQPQKTGVVIHPNYFGLNKHPKFGLGKTLIHEVGHYLGLYHLWGDNSDCENDDGVADTPPQLKAYKGCPIYPQSGCSVSEMFMNFMDYVDDGCMYFFTKGQVERMVATLNLFRSGLNNSEIGCNDSANTNQEILIYPNPSNGLFQIKSKYGLSNDILMFNNIGQLIHPKIKRELEIIKMDFTNFPSGLYYLKVDETFFKLVKID